MYKKVGQKVCINNKCYNGMFYYIYVVIIYYVVYNQLIKKGGYTKGDINRETEIQGDNITCDYYHG
jgi:hypothetical protein